MIKCIEAFKMLEHGISVILNFSEYKNSLKPLATSVLLLFLLVTVSSGLILIIFLNRNQTWSRPFGYMGFIFLIMGELGAFSSDSLKPLHYYQISAPILNIKMGTVFAKVQFDVLDPVFKQMLVDAKNGKIRCFVRTHLENNFGSQGSSEIIMNQAKQIVDKQNAELDAKFLEEFLQNPRLSFEFELSDKNMLIYKDIGTLSKGRKITGRRKDEILINNKMFHLPSNQLLIYFLFKDLNDKPLAVFL